MSKVHERLKAQSQVWENSGRDKDYLLPPLDAALANLWLYHHGGGTDRSDNVPSPVDPDGSLQAFVDKSLEGVDVMEIWAEKDVCRSCYETFRLENMYTCTSCDTSYCWRCMSKRDNNQCGCGGEMY